MAHSKARINILWSVKPSLKNGTQTRFLNGFINTQFCAVEQHFLLYWKLFIWRSSLHTISSKNEKRKHLCAGIKIFK